MKTAIKLVLVVLFSTFSTYSFAVSNPTEVWTELLPTGERILYWTFPAGETVTQFKINDYPHNVR